MEYAKPVLGTTQKGCVRACAPHCFTCVCQVFWQQVQKVHTKSTYDFKWKKADKREMSLWRIHSLSFFWYCAENLYDVSKTWCFFSQWLKDVIWLILIYYGKKKWEKNKDKCHKQPYLSLAPPSSFNFGGLYTLPVRSILLLYYIPYLPQNKAQNKAVNKVHKS